MACTNGCSDFEHLQKLGSGHMKTGGAPGGLCSEDVLFVLSSMKMTQV